MNSGKRKDIVVSAQSIPCESKVKISRIQGSKDANKDSRARFGLSQDQFQTILGKIDVFNLSPIQNRYPSLLMTAGSDGRHNKTTMVRYVAAELARNTVARFKANPMTESRHNRQVRTWKLETKTLTAHEMDFKKCR